MQFQKYADLCRIVFSMTDMKVLYKGRVPTEPKVLIRGHITSQLSFEACDAAEYMRQSATHEVRSNSQMGYYKINLKGLRDSGFVSVSGQKFGLMEHLDDTREDLKYQTNANEIFFPKGTLPLDVKSFGDSPPVAEVVASEPVKPQALPAERYRTSYVAKDPLKSRDLFQSTQESSETPQEKAHPDVAPVELSTEIVPAETVNPREEAVVIPPSIPSIARVETTSTEKVPEPITIKPVAGSFAEFKSNAVMLNQLLSQTPTLFVSVSNGILVLEQEIEEFIEI